MRLPRFRYSVRGMMIAVAIVGIGVGIESMRRRRVACLEKAYEWRKLEWVDTQMADYHENYSAPRYDESARNWELGVEESRKLAAKFGEQNALIPGSVEAQERNASDARNRARSAREEAHRERARAVWTGALARKYERAARYPWLSVAPDPPEPE